MAEFERDFILRQIQQLARMVAQIVDNSSGVMR